MSEIAKWDKSMLESIKGVVKACGEEYFFNVFYSFTTIIGLFHNTFNYINSNNLIELVKGILYEARIFSYQKKKNAWRLICY